MERARQRLCEIRDFAPYSAFQRLDRDANESISSMEVVSFLRDSGLRHITESECFDVVNFFDADQDGRLTYNEFLQIVLPCEDNLLRNITLDRHATRVGRFDHLPRDIESALASVFEQEINLQRRMNVLKKELEYSYDFSTYAAFRSIDRDNNGILSTFEMS